MATTQRRPRPEKPPAVRERMTRGFDYLTLDPSPRLRKLRDEQGEKPEPAEVIRQAWQSVGAAIAKAFRITREAARPPSR
jgi:hypothetical protein